MQEVLRQIGSGRPVPLVLGELRQRGGLWIDLATEVERMAADWTEGVARASERREVGRRQFLETGDPHALLSSLFPSDSADE